MMEQEKPWIVFDIDGTLSMTLDQEDFESLEFNEKQYFQPIEYESLGKKQITVWVMIRPHLKVLLEFAFKNYQVGVWSIGQPNYVNSIVQHLFFDNGFKPEFVYNFTHCYRDYEPHLRFYKPLSKSPAKGGILIEDSPEVVDFQDEHIIIQRFDIFPPDNTTDSEESSESDRIEFDLLIGDNILLSLIKILKL